MFDIRYSFREQGKFLIFELPAAGDLAKHFRKIDHYDFFYVSTSGFENDFADALGLVLIDPMLRLEILQRSRENR
jgi:hypothetical protein